MGGALPSQGRTPWWLGLYIEERGKHWRQGGQPAQRLTVWGTHNIHRLLLGSEGRGGLGKSFGSGGERKRADSLGLANREPGMGRMVGRVI